MRYSLLALLLGSFAALGAVDGQEIATCAAEKNTVERLSCYDRVASRHELAPATKKTIIEGSGNWITNSSTDPLTDNYVHLAMLEASSGAGRYGETVNLVVRCADNKTVMYINWQAFLGLDSTTVTYRIGKTPAQKGSWNVSTDNTSSFFPGSVVPTLKQMLDETDFIANVTPHSANPITAVFDISGIGNALKDVRHGCGW